MPRAKRTSTAESKPRRSKAVSLAAETAAVPAAVNLAESYGVRVIPAQATAGQNHWRVISVRHLPPEENRGRHNVYVDAKDESGQRCRDAALRIGWTWEGRQADQAAEPKLLDKPDNEPAGNVDVNLGQHIEAWIEGDGLPSDHVANMHTKHADEPGSGGDVWNSVGHHSFHVVFQRARAEGQKPELEPPPPPPPPAFHFGVWPTEVRIVTQPFGVRPEYYSQFGLPGHEGVDIAAPIGSRIFCVAPGRIKMLHPEPTGHAYGTHVRVQHDQGYETIYAHLTSLEVVAGQAVQAGQVLGRADHTGNASGDHLHLTLKHQGETLGKYPNNIVDPTRFLEALLTATVDGAAYVTDKVPDGSSFPPSSSFPETWRMRNTGARTWGAGYALALFGGDGLGAPASVPLPATAPGQQGDINVTFHTPPKAGRYRSIWRCRNAAGEWFGDRVWVDIQVGEYQPAGRQITARDKLGVDANAPIDPHTGAISLRVDDSAIIGDIGAGWVRLNFILGPWQEPLDPAQHSGRTWVETYSKIIDGLRGRGLRIYGLISAEAMRDSPWKQFRNPPPAGPFANDWIRRYAETFRTITRLFHDKVEVFETFNEPDNWLKLEASEPDGEWKRNWIRPEWFAIMLQEIWNRVRGDPETAGIKIVSGPLQGLDTGNSARGYLRRTYQAGRDRFRWGQGGVPFPFDGVGYHLYIAQDPPNPDQDVPVKYNQYMNELRQVILDEERGAKPIFVSEMGWPSAIGEAKQVTCMQAGLRRLLDDAGVALGIWFCTQDWSETWGLYRQGDLLPGSR